MLGIIFWSGLYITDSVSYFCTATNRPYLDPNSQGLTGCPFTMPNHLYLIAAFLVISSPFLIIALFIKKKFLTHEVGDDLEQYQPQ